MTMPGQATRSTGDESIIVPLISGEDRGLVDVSTFKRVVGQNDAKSVLGFYIASHSNAHPIPSLIFNGSHGLGKSFFARMVTKALGRELVEVNCANVDDTKYLFENIIMDRILGDKPKTLFMDEAQGLKQDVEDVFLSFLNPNPKGYNDVAYKNLKFRFDFRKINVIFATTDSYKISKALINRCEEIYFKTYSNEELLQIVSSYLPGITIGCNESEVAYSCRGRARDAFRLAQNIDRYCSMKSVVTVDNDGWREIKSIFGIYHNGLRREEVALLKMLHKDGVMSVRNIAIRMGVGIQNVESELEVRPRELGFITNSSRGRELTEEGIEYLNEMEAI